jgi:hypothetical protein
MLAKVGEGEGRELMESRVRERKVKRLSLCPFARVEHVERDQRNLIVRQDAVSPFS